MKGQDIPPRRRHTSSEDEEMAEFMAQVHRSANETSGEREISLGLDKASLQQAQAHARRFTRGIKNKIAEGSKDNAPYNEAPYLSEPQPSLKSSLSLGKRFSGIGPAGRVRNGQNAGLAQKHPRPGHRPGPGEDPYKEFADLLDSPRKKRSQRRADRAAAKARSKAKKVVAQAAPVPREQFRGYRPRPARPNTNPSTSPGASSSTVNIKLTLPTLSRRLAIRCMVLAIVVGVIFGAVKLAPVAFVAVRNVGAAPNPIAKEDRDKVSAPLYTPETLPEGYHISSTPVTQPDEAVVIYTIENDTGRKLYVSQQQQRTDFKYDEFIGGLGNRQEFATPLGKLTIGEASNGQTVASLLTGKTWIMANTSKGSLTYFDILDIFKHLRQV